MKVLAVDQMAALQLSKVDALALSALEVKYVIRCSLIPYGTGTSDFRLPPSDGRLALRSWHFVWKDTNREPGWFSWILYASEIFNTLLMSKMSHAFSVGCCGFGQNEGCTTSYEVWEEELTLGRKDSGVLNATLSSSNMQYGSCIDEAASSNTHLGDMPATKKQILMVK